MHANVEKKLKALQQPLAKKEKQRKDALFKPPNKKPRNTLDINKPRTIAKKGSNGTGAACVYQTHRHDQIRIWWGEVRQHRRRERVTIRAAREAKTRSQKPPKERGQYADPKCVLCSGIKCKSKTTHQENPLVVGKRTTRPKTVCCC